MNKYQNFFVCVAFVEENWCRISFNNLAMMCNTSGEDQCQAPLGGGERRNSPPESCCHGSSLCNFQIDFTTNYTYLSVIYYVCTKEKKKVPLR